MAVWTDRIQSLGDAADRRNLGVDFAAGQNAALSGLGALGELDLEHAHLLVCGHRTQLPWRQRTAFVTYTVLCRADLEHDVRASFEMVGRQTPFTGVHPNAGLACSV